MKAALILKGNARIPDGEKLKKYGVKRCYYEAIDTQIDAAFMRDLRSWGFEAGVMVDPIWSGYQDSPEDWIRKRVQPQIDRLAPKGPDGKRPQLSVLLDIERHDAGYVFAALTEFNRLNEGRNCAWTCEFHQGGWFSEPLVGLINEDPQMKVVPQCYYGDMDHAVDSHAAARDLYTPHGGINDNRVCFFYTLRASLPLAWDGILYLENWTQLP